MNAKCDDDVTEFEFKCNMLQNRYFSIIKIKSLYFFNIEIENKWFVRYIDYIV